MHPGTIEHQWYLNDCRLERQAAYEDWLAEMEEEMARDCSPTPYLPSSWAKDCNTNVDPPDDDIPF